MEVEAPNFDMGSFCTNLYSVYWLIDKLIQSRNHRLRTCDWLDGEADHSQRCGNVNQAMMPYSR